MVGKSQGSRLKKLVHKPGRLAGSRHQIKKVQEFPCQICKSLVDALFKPRHCRPAEEVVLGAQLRFSTIINNYNDSVEQKYRLYPGIWISLYGIQI